MKRNIINPWKWQYSIGFVQANDLTRSDRMLICAGQTLVDAEGIPMHEGDLHAQITSVFPTWKRYLPKRV